jgi:tRNA dimethylallyltransferase
MNQNINYNKTLIVILGPTAIGKTALSIKLARHFNTEIISSDSRQLFKEMKIGTAVPSTEELNSVKHHFIGNLSISDYYNVSKFEKEALHKLDDIFLKNNLAIMVGGSGLYIDAVCKGIDDLPDPDRKLRHEINEIFKSSGIETLQKKLKELDPEYYLIVDLKNPKRLMRAIEVCLQTGKTYTSLRKNKTGKRDFNIIKIGLNCEREKLFDRINLRVDKMINEGLLDEVKELYKHKNLNSLNTVGYKEIFDFLDNKTSFEQAIENIKTNTRRYAKRQLTWFKRDEVIKWFHPTEKNEIILYLSEKIDYA